MKRIELLTCTVRYDHHEYIDTIFNDGKMWGAYPHDNHHYHVIAHRCGYGDDIWAYAFEHEFIHSFLAQELDRGNSYVLWSLAHNQKPDPIEAMKEEVLVQTFQRWMRANERPIIGGIDWDDLKSKALGML